MIEIEMLTPEEIEDLRIELVRTNAECRAAIKQHGIGLHPRVAAMKAHISFDDSMRHD